MPHHQEGLVQWILSVQAVLMDKVPPGHEEATEPMDQYMPVPPDIRSTTGLSDDQKAYVEANNAKKLAQARNQGTGIF